MRIIKQENKEIPITIIKKKNQGNILSSTQEKLLLGIKGKTSNDVEAIQKSITKIHSLDDIKEIVEWPLISTVEQFFLRKIGTVSSSANGKNIHITLSYDTLSLKNKKIAEELGGTLSCSGWSGFRPVISFSMPPKVTPTEEITRWGESLAKQFQHQSFIKVPSYSFEKFATVVMKKPGATRDEILSSPYMAAYIYNKQYGTISLKPSFF